MFNIYYSEVIMSAMTSLTTRVSIFYLTVCSGADERKNQSYASLAFVRGIHQWPVNSTHKGPATMISTRHRDSTAIWKYMAGWGQKWICRL